MQNMYFTNMWGSQNEPYPEVSTIERKEVDLFSSIPISKWMDVSGIMKGLHDMNAIRVPFIGDMYKRRQVMTQNIPANSKNSSNWLSSRRDIYRARWNQRNRSRTIHGLLHLMAKTGPNGVSERPCDAVLNNLNVLEVGAGAGILSRELSMKGAKVVALEPAEILCKSAIEYHKDDDNVRAGSLDFIPSAIETDRLLKQDGSYMKITDRPFDIVIMSEVVEHVSKGTLKTMLSKATEWTSPGGLVIITTPHRTPLSRFLVITIAEKVLKIVPKGSHHYNKFVKPEEVQHVISSCNALDTKLIGHSSDCYIPGLFGRHSRGLFIPDLFPRGWVHYMQAYRILN